MKSFNIASCNEIAYDRLLECYKKLFESFFLFLFHPESSCTVVL